MIALLLTCLAPSVPAAAQEAGHPARLHPANTIVYFEAPDVAGLLEAYSHAPVAQMIDDSQVRAAVTELMSSIEVDLEQVLTQTADEVHVPAEFLTSPRQTLVNHLEGLASFSGSVSIREAAPGELEETLGRLMTTLRGLRDLAERLGTFADEHDGAYPPSLAELGLEPDRLADGWARPYEYAADATAGTFELRSLGADGAAGGEGIDADLDSTTPLEETLASELIARVGATVVFEFSTDLATAQWSEGLQSLLDNAPLHPSRTYTLGEEDPGEVAMYDLPELANEQAWTLLHGSRLILGFGSSTPEDYFDRLADAAPNAGQSPGYASMLSRLPQGAGATVLRGFLSLERLGATAKELAQGSEEDWDAMMSSLASTAWRMELVGDRFVTDLYTGTPDADNELTRCFASEPLSADLRKVVPADSVIVAAVSIDASLVHRKIMESLRASADEDEEEPATKLSEMEERYGFSLEDDVFGNIGSGAAFYMLPVAGLMSIPGMGVALELKDPEAFQHGLEGLLALLGDQGSEDFEIRYRPYHDLPMWYFKFNNTGGSPIQLSPSLVIVDRHLIVTLTSLRAKKEIKRLTEEPGGLHPLFAEHVPEDATAAWYVDWPALTDGIYGAGRAMLALMGGGEGLPFDPALLPESQLFTHFFQPTFAWSRRTDAGVHTRLESSFGPETVVGIAGLAFAGTAVAKQAFATPEVSEEVVVEETPAPPPTETEDLAASTRETLRYLATRLAVYRLEAERYPAELDDLLAPTENYPRGFLDAETLPTDAWERPFRYTVTEDGAAFRLWSTGPDGVDQSGGGDDLTGD